MHRDRRKGNNCYGDFDTCLEKERQMETYSYIKDSGRSHGLMHPQEKAAVTLFAQQQPRETTA